MKILALGRPCLLSNPAAHMYHAELPQLMSLETVSTEVPSLYECT